MINNIYIPTSRFCCYFPYYFFKIHLTSFCRPLHTLCCYMFQIHFSGECFNTYAVTFHITYFYLSSG